MSLHVVLGALCGALLMVAAYMIGVWVGEAVWQAECRRDLAKLLTECAKSPIAGCDAEARMRQAECVKNEEMSP